jgi:lipopolysaccharide transport system permease protein
VLSGLVDFGIQFVILVGMMLFYGYQPRWAMLTVPLFVLAAAATALAVGLWVASWRVHYHDVANIMGFVMRGWMYATPVVYAVSLIPDRWSLLYRLNPMTNVIQSFRWALLGAGQAPDWVSLLSLAAVLPVLVSGAFYFRRAERTIVDYA